MITPAAGITGTGIPMVKTIIKIICAWCKCDMGTKDGKGISGISHGMCDKCFKEQMWRR